MSEIKSTIAAVQDHLILLAETIGELRERLEKIETDFTAQAAPLDAAGKVLDAALNGSKTLQSHILAQDIAQLAAKLDGVKAELSASVMTEAEGRARALAVLNAALEGKLATIAQRLDAERVRLSAQRTDDRLDLAECHGRLQALDSQFGTTLEALKEIRVRLAAPPTAFNPRGDWIDGGTFNRLDIASLIGSSYISLEDGNRDRPSRNSKKWMLLAARGGSGGGVPDITGIAGIHANVIGWLQDPTSAKLRTEIGRAHV